MHRKVRVSRSIGSSPTTPIVNIRGSLILRRHLGEVLPNYRAIQRSYVASLRAKRSRGSAGRSVEKRAVFLVNPPRLAVRDGHEAIDFTPMVRICQDDICLRVSGLERRIPRIL